MKEKTNKAKILSSKLYLDEKDFSVNEISGDIGSKPKTIAPLLHTLCEQGLVTKIEKPNGRIAYRKSVSSLLMLSQYWPHLPATTEYTPGYC